MLRVLRCPLPQGERAHRREPRLRQTGRASHLHLAELAVLDLVGAERDLDDVAVVGELARAGRARVLDLLALGERLEPIERVVDLHGTVVVRDLADTAADAGPG